MILPPSYHYPTTIPPLFHHYPAPIQPLSCSQHRSHDNNIPPLSRQHSNQYTATISPIMGLPWAHDGPKLGPPWAHDGPKLVPSWAHDGPKFGPHLPFPWAHDAPKLGLSQPDPRVARVSELLLNTRRALGSSGLERNRSAERSDPSKTLPAVENCRESAEPSRDPDKTTHEHYRYVGTYGCFCYNNVSPLWPNHCGPIMGPEWVNNVGPSDNLYSPNTKQMLNWFAVGAPPQRKR
jgi:hypothetical protein